MVEPSPAPRTSALAVASLVLGVLACVPFLGLVAVILASISLFQMRASRGRLEGGAFAAVGLSMGLFNLLVSSVISLALWADDSPVATAPVVAPAPIATTAPSGSPRTPSGDEGGQMTTINEVTEVMVGTVRLVDVPPTKRSLADELEAQRALAIAAREGLMLFTGAEGCRPCMSIAAVLAEPRMQSALGRTRLVRVDVNALSQELEELGVPSKKIPGFYLLGKDLSPTDGINGGEWVDDTADNAGPVLGSFLRGTLRRRAEPFRPLPHRTRVAPARPSGTFL